MVLPHQKANSQPAGIRSAFLVLVRGVLERAQHLLDRCLCLSECSMRAITVTPVTVCVSVIHPATVWSCRHWSSARKSVHPSAGAVIWNKEVCGKNRKCPSWSSHVLPLIEFSSSICCCLVTLDSFPALFYSCHRCQGFSFLWLPLLSLPLKLMTWIHQEQFIT